MKNLLLLVNPFSGKGKSVEAAEFISQELSTDEWHLEIILSEYKGFFTDFLKGQDLIKFDTMVVIGGDGTMHEVINGIDGKDNIPPIHLFPCGTGNAFNHDLNCLNWETAIERIKAGKVQKIDIFKISTTKTHTKNHAITKSLNHQIIGFNVAGWGLVSGINLLAEKLRWMGQIRYSVASFLYIFKNPKFYAKIKIDEDTIEGNFSFVLICNNKFTGDAMKIAPLADFSDGLLDVLVIKHLSIFRLLMLFPMIFSGKHIHSKYVDYRKAKKVKLEAEPLVLIIDGEIKSHCPFELEILDRQIEMIV